MASIRQVAENHNLTMAEVALRWISHHSFLSRKHGDAILIGASSVEHIEQVRNFLNIIIVQFCQACVTEFGGLRERTFAYVQIDIGPK